MCSAHACSCLPGAPVYEEAARAFRLQTAVALFQVQAGWGKQLSYVVAFSRHGVTDVIKRYTKQWDQLKQRRSMVTEEWLSQQCTHLTNHARR